MSDFSKLLIFLRESSLGAEGAASGFLSSGFTVLVTFTLTSRRLPSLLLVIDVTFPFFLLLLGEGFGDVLEMDEDS